MLKGLLRHFVRASAAVPDVEEELLRIRDLMKSGDYGSAAPPLEHYLRRHPRDPKALHLRGLIDLEGGRFADAAESITRAVEYDPESPIYRANLGLALWRQGLLIEARPHFEVAVDIEPHLSSACLNLAGLLRALGEPFAAKLRLERALEHAEAMTAVEQAQVWGAMAALADILPGIEARDCLDRAHALDPDSELIDLLRYLPMAQQCDWSYPAAKLAAFFERLGDSHDPESEVVIAPFLADCLPVTPRGRYAAARRACLLVEERVRAMQFAAPRRAAGSDGKIRLGYLSADFHNHPTMHLLRGVLREHDRTLFELHAYSSGSDDGSVLRREAESLFNCFHDIRGESSLASAGRIAADGIDILIDLKGYTGDARPEIPALRPAPVQVNYLGYPGTMAAGFMDYLIADAILVRAGEERWYGERIATLPHSYQPNDNQQTISGDPVSRAEAGLPETGFIYCSFNNPYKIEPRIFSVWMDVLRAVPDAVLWIFADRADARVNLCREADARGIAPERLVFAGAMPKDRHLARMGLADVFLDTHFVNAHTTASDALWAGVPLLTCPGDSFSSRVASSLLSAMGLPELICADLDAYRTLAIELAGNRSRLADLRARLQAARFTAPLFDTAGYTRALEAAYITMHEIAHRGDPPAAFCVPRSLRHA